MKSIICLQMILQIISTAVIANPTALPVQFSFSGDPCSGFSTVKGSFGDFSSPVDENDKYPLNVDCIWIIKAENQADTRIRLSFNKFDVEKQSRCLYDYVAVYSGEMQNVSLADPDKSLGKYCGNEIPNDLLSEGPTMSFHFHSDYFQAETGFSIEFEEVNAEHFHQSGCGGVRELTEDNGTFASMNYPGYYNLNSRCDWLITAPVGKIVGLQFSSFDLYETDAIGCKDKVSIYDGDSTSADILNGFCGQQANEEFIHSNSNAMTIVFESGDEGQGTGFKASYQFRTQEHQMVQKVEYSQICGVSSIPINNDIPTARVFGGQPVVLGSWPWQASLRSCKSCSHICGGTILTDTWVITATHCLLSSPTYVVVGDFSHVSAEFPEAIVKISEVISFPSFGENIANNNDLTLIKVEEPIKLSKWIRPVCLPTQNLSLSTEFGDAECFITGWGETETDHFSNELREARVPLLNQSTCLARYTSHAVNDNMFCAGKGTTDACQGDSGGPLVCRTAVGGPWVLYGITSFGWGCGRSEYPGVYTRVPLYTDWIIKNPNLTRGTNIIWKKTESNTRLNLSSEVTPDPPTDIFPLGESGCGGDSLLLHAQEGYFNTSFIYDVNYTGPLDCQWTIFFLPDVDNKFLYLKIEFGINDDAYISPNATQCTDEKLFIQNLENDVSYGPYCSSTGTGNITFISEASLRVEYIADPNNDIKGFYAKYYVEDDKVEESMCGGPYNIMPNSTITTLNFPAKYLSNAHCKWLVQAESSEHFLKLTFNYFEVEEGHGCAYDYLKATELLNGEKYIHSRLCGNDLPDPIIVSSTTLLEFVSDGSINMGGFSIDISEVSYMPSIPSGCGGEMYLTESNGNFHTINYPNLYDGNIECIWIIIVDPEYKVSVTFVDFDVEYSPSCKFDYVSLYNDNRPVEDNFVAKICGSKGKEKVSTIKFTYLSESNVMTIQFISDVGNNRKGFSAEYSSVLPIQSRSVERILIEEDEKKYKTKNASDSCGDVIFTENENTIVYDGNLSKNPIDSGIICHYEVIVGDKNKFIKLWISENSYIDLDEYDCLLIFEGIDSETEDSSITICGNDNQDTLNSNSKYIILESSEISVVLISNKERLGTKSVFKLFYSSVEKNECGKKVDSSWPWIVSLISSNGFHFCSGILLSNRWILTAASCYFIVENNHAVISGERRMKVEFVINHPDHGRDYGLPVYDIALLKLSLPTTKAPICLPTNQDFNAQDFDGKSCFLLGWSFKDIITGEVNSKTIQDNSVKIIPHCQCNVLWYGRLSDDMECGWIRGRNACRRVAGRPLVCQTEDQIWKVIGVASWGSRICMENRKPILPNVFTWISKSSDWINNITGIH